MSLKNNDCQTSFDAERKIWSGNKIAPIYDEKMSVGKAVIKSLQRNPNHICQICYHNGKVYKNAEIALLSIRIAQHFDELKISHGEIVGIVAGNTDLLAPLVFGALSCGLTICPIDPTVDNELIKQFFKITKPALVFTVGAAYEKVKNCLNEIAVNATIYTMNDHKRGVLEITEFLAETGHEKNFDAKPLKDNARQTAVLLRSSGTTSAPKTICVSHATVLTAYSEKLPSNDVVLRNSSIHWIAGFNRLVDSCLQNYTSLIHENGFKPSMVPELMTKYKLTIPFTSPPFLADMLDLPDIQNVDFSKFRSLRTGGCNVPSTLIEKAKIYMPHTEFKITYGFSEIGGSVTSGPYNVNNNAGKLVPNMQLKIVDEEGMSLSIGEIGEICTRNIYPWAGYYQNPEMTAKVYRDGWIHSSDFGYVSEDGNLFVIERMNDVVKYMEHTIYPSEIENIIQELPGIVEACVCGIPDEKAGHLLSAGIIKSKNSDLTPKDVFDYVSKRVDDYKNLRGGVYFTNFLPKTLTGKCLRFRVGNFCESQRRMKLEKLTISI